MELEEFEKEFKNRLDWQELHYSRYVHIYVSKTTFFVANGYAIFNLKNVEMLRLKLDDKISGVLDLKSVKRVF
ncbi:MAG: hypothetical protein ACP5M9_04385 [Candidatus Micrarchaeia archaeon]